jgi:translation initiation factor IF-3
VIEADPLQDGRNMVMMLAPHKEAVAVKPANEAGDADPSAASESETEHETPSESAPEAQTEPENDVESEAEVETEVEAEAETPVTPA